MQTTLQNETPPDQRVEMLRLRDEISKASDELAMRISGLHGDILAARSNPDVLDARRKLCRLHMKAMVSCTYDPVNHESVAKLCQELSQPRNCVKLLQLSEEETCCARFTRIVT